MTLETQTPSRAPTPEQLAAEQPKRLHLLGYAPCPVRNTFKDHCEELLSRSAAESKLTLDWHLPSSCAHHGDPDAYASLWKAERIEDFPDVVVSFGFGDFLKRELGDRFGEKGFFRAAWNGPIEPAFEQAGLRDPRGWYTVHAVWPYVMMVDTRKLGGRPAPRRWSDLLDPIYRDDIVVNGASDRKFSDVPLLYFHKRHGVEGLRRYAAQVRDSWHPAEMVKAINRADPERPAIYVLPYFFARARQRPEEVPIVWPEEGALVSPMYFLAKSKLRPGMESVVAGLTGEAMGRKYAAVGFPFMRPGLDAGIPPGARFDWLGWDYVRQNDMEALRARISAIATEAWETRGRVA
jgi:ABC-type Fe3+ transport system substrate-binding protein